MALLRDDLADMEDEQTRKTMIPRAICDSGHSAPLSCYVQLLFAKVTYRSLSLDSRSKQD